MCSFWDVTVSDWSSDGCEVISVTGNTVTCASDHLTIFGSLVQVSCLCVRTCAYVLLLVCVCVCVCVVECECVFARAVECV